MIADTHIHVWNFQQAYYLWLEGDNSILNRTYNIEEIETERKNLGIVSGVLVQAANNLEDTNWMLQVAKTTNWISGVVGWLPLTDPVATQKLLEEKYVKEKYFKGVRHLIHDEEDSKWLLQPAVIESLQLLAAHDIPYDVVGVLPAHIETVLKVSELVPNLRMVFDHLNQPPIFKKEKFGAWGPLMKTAAQHKNMYAKISGLGTASGDPEGWRPDDLKPYVEFALQNFGTDRCFCGGDWPVSLLAGSYTKIWKAYEQIINELISKEDAAKVFYTNAQKFYNL
jgi:L-fuconolactonase